MAVAAALAEVVEAQPVQTGPAGRWQPHSRAEVGVAHRAPVRVDEQLGALIGSGEATASQVFGQHLDQRRRHGHGAPSRSRLGGAGHEATVRLAHALLDGDGTAEQVEPADLQPGALAEPEPEHRADIDHGPVVVSHFIGQAVQLPSPEWES